MISIIIPTWNEEECLPKLLECIKKQSYKDYEIIVADANSKDKTVTIAKKHGCKIVKSGSKELALEVEKKGYGWVGREEK